MANVSGEVKDLGWDKSTDAAYRCAEFVQNTVSPLF